jgi:8-amino-7-oxononanoate synthase
MHETNVDAAKIPAHSDTPRARAITLVRLNVQWLLSDIVQSLWRAGLNPQAHDPVSRSFPRSQAFEELPSYKSITKHRKVAERFGFSDPFYRCHEESLGAETLIEGRLYLNFASYNYLGLNRHPAVVEAAKAAIDQYGTSVSASRIVAGERPFHRDLEAALADHYGTESALTFVSGHATNVTTIGTLLRSDDIIFYDELVHNSVLVGAKLSGAMSWSFRHNDMDALEARLRHKRPTRKNALIIVEGLYSMDGDIPDLPRLLELKERYGAWLMVDEAHSTGVLGRSGRGIAEHYGIDPARVDIWMGTLSKALAGCGGYIAGSHQLIELLKFQAAGQVYSVGMSPPVAAAALASLALLKAEPERVSRLQANGKLFLEEAKSRGLDTITSRGYAITPVMVGDIVKAGRLTDRMRARQVNVLPIIYPAVPLKAARLRFFITSEHTPKQIRDAAAITADELRRTTES